MNLPVHVRMKRRSITLNSQRGISLIVGMIMLLLITLMSTAAFTLSTTNSKLVGNIQFRDEAIASVNIALEQASITLLPTGFTTLPTGPTIYTIDINNDGVTDYSVSIAIPACIQSQLGGSAGEIGGSSVSLGDTFSGTGNYYNTMWDIAANLTDAISGTTIEIHQGLRIALSETQKSLVCP